MPLPIEFTTVSTVAEVRQILDLQAANLAAALTPDTMASQGFVTVRHDPDVLRRMNETAPAIIAKDGDRVVGYALVMPREFAADVPILRPLFQMLDGLSWRGLPLRDQARWFVMGQICIAAAYRGRGIFDGLYRAMGDASRNRYDFTVTEVAARNGRSLRAHARAGFRTLHVYADATTGEEWHVIVLDFDGNGPSEHGRDRMSGMPTAPTKLVLEATYEELRQRADALKAAFTEPSMVAFVEEATADLDDAGELLKGTEDTPAVLMTADFFLQYAVANIKQLEGVLRKFGSGVTTIR